MFRLWFGLLIIIFVNFTIITFFCFFSFCSSSLSGINNLGFPFLLNAFKDLALMCSFLIIWWVRPYLQFVHSLCLRSLSVVSQWLIQFSPVWLAWFDNPASNVRLSHSTFPDVSFNSPLLVQSTATTDGTHEDHPVMESNVVHE